MADTESKDGSRHRAKHRRMPDAEQAESAERMPADPLELGLHETDRREASPLQAKPATPEVSAAQSAAAAARFGNPLDAKAASGAAGASSAESRPAAATASRAYSPAEDLRFAEAAAAEQPMPLGNEARQAPPTAAATSQPISDTPSSVSSAQMPPLPPFIPDLPPVGADAGATARSANAAGADGFPGVGSVDGAGSASLAQMPPRPPVIPGFSTVASDSRPDSASDSVPDSLPSSSPEPVEDLDDAPTRTLPAVHARAHSAAEAPVASSSVATLAPPATAAAALAPAEHSPAVDARREAAEPKKRKTPIWVHVTGIIGELLLTAGVLIGLYISWQLWFSSWEANTMQSKALTEATQEWQEAPQTIGAPRTDPPPEFPHVTEMGSTIGIIRIPAFGKDWEYLILQGADKAVIDKGYFGHYSETAYPGEVGNFAMAAHRNTYGAPMHYVDQLKAGDPIIVETDQAYLVYKMYQDPYVVKPTQGDVIWPVPSDHEASANPTRRLLTITTCHPYIGIQIERMITHAEFDHWVARSDGIPQEMADAQ